MFEFAYSISISFCMYLNINGWTLSKYTKNDADAIFIPIFPNLIFLLLANNANKDSEAIKIKGELYTFKFKTEIL